MDIVSHGLWGGIAFGRKSKALWRLAFFFGVMPDLFAFGPFFVQRIFTHGFDFSGPPAASTIPHAVYQIYNVTHSLVIFAAVFLIARLIWKRWVWEMLAWAFHVVLDIFTHSSAFFPTPFLWPMSSYHFSGAPWSRPEIFFPNLALLAAAYIVFYFNHKKPKNFREPADVEAQFARKQAG